MDMRPPNDYKCKNSSKWDVETGDPSCGCHIGKFKKQDGRFRGTLFRGGVGNVVRIYDKAHPPPPSELTNQSKKTERHT